MIKAILFAVALGSAASAASAAPLLNQSHAGRRSGSLTQEVRVVCEENGVCYRPPERRPGRQVGLWRRRLLRALCRARQLWRAGKTLQHDPFLVPLVELTAGLDHGSPGVTGVRPACGRLFG